MIQEDVLYLLARSIHLLPFEARKDAQTIFSHALRFNKSPDPDRPNLPALTYATETRPEVIVELCRGYRHSQSALPCGSILREALKHKLVAGVILYDQSKDSQRAVRLGEVDVEERQSGEGVFWEFFGWINQSAFEVSADAFTTFRVRVSPLLLRWREAHTISPGNSHEAQEPRGSLFDEKL
jgi:calcium binding protein 39